MLGESHRMAQPEKKGLCDTVCHRFVSRVIGAIVSGIDVYSECIHWLMTWVSCTLFSSKHILHPSEPQVSHISPILGSYLMHGDQMHLQSRSSISYLLSPRRYTGSYKYGTSVRSKNRHRTKRIQAGESKHQNWRNPDQRTLKSSPPYPRDCSMSSMTL